MRTTVNIDDDVFEAARAMAAQLGISLGEALSTLARRGLRPDRSLEGDHGLPVFDVPPDAPLIPTTRAQDLLADEGLE